VRRLSKQFTLLTLASLIAFAFAACSSNSGGSADTTVAATVNGKQIMLKEIERVIHQQAQGKEAQMSAHDLAQARLQVLDGLIQNEVQYQRADQEKLLPTEEQITSAINAQKQQGGVTQEDFDRQLKEQGLTPEAYREDIKKALAIKALQDKYAGKISISDREVEDYYNANKAQFVNARGVALAMIAVDPGDNSKQGITGDDAKNDADAKTKIDAIYQQLKTGADFATLARAKSEDAQSLVRGGDIGFATEEDLKGNGFPPDLVSQFFGAMQAGSYSAPVKFNSPQYPGGRWYIFKLQEKHLTTENLTLESQGVRQQITVKLTDERKNILNAALVTVALSEAKIVNNLAVDMLSNPSNLGLRPASTEAAKPAASATPAAASTALPAAKTAASPAKAAASPKK
jgi:peptidyl-prolyl cis-trans isomerase SurA